MNLMNVKALCPSCNTTMEAQYFPYLNGDPVILVYAYYCVPCNLKEAGKDHEKSETFNDYLVRTQVSL